MTIAMIDEVAHLVKTNVVSATHTTTHYFNPQIKHYHQYLPLSIS